ncbi:hypothetical protein C6P40_002037 [Pichia californica]|uniref:Uncharacterized protein n=1 Tax=Pichia californica TaxID=460514 RepID=A0A9P6WL18_9ASCO|nr:hypothetical protein C6P40_002037 [[Candida] californica]
MQCVSHCNNPVKAEYFDQPVLQTLQMFVGELLCWIPFYIIKYYRKKSTIIINDEETEASRLVNDTTENVEDIVKVKTTIKRSPILALPAICDLLGTTIMNIGLLYTPVSIYQMTRGSVILIVGLMSVIFLQKKITKLEWISLIVVFFGVFLVGLSGYFDNGKSNDEVMNAFGEVIESLDIIFGMVLIFMGITMTAIQFVVEEHILSHFKLEPMEIVGYEGFYGSIIASHIMFFGKLLYGKGIWDMNKSFSQVFHNPVILSSSLLIMLYICIFNFCGITLTFLLSATSRSTIDTSRTLLVWLISLAIGWENFHWLQLLAFGMLVGGTLSFNGVIQPETWKITPKWLKDLENEIHI